MTMTDADFAMKADALILAGWREKADASSFRWREDKRYGDSGALYYIGGESGQYIKLANDGRLMVGDYTNTSPGIENTVLSYSFMRQFSSYEEACVMTFRLGGDRLAAELFGDAERLMALVDKNRSGEYTSVLKAIQDDKAVPKPPRITKPLEKDKVWDAL